MNQAYCNRVRSELRKSPSEWDGRIRQAARRLLSAICFRETAETTFRKTESALLPPIAFYYSLYHAVIAALWVDYRTKPETLRRAKHKTVAVGLASNLVKAQLIDSSVADLLQELRTFREYANYTVGSKLPGDRQYLNAIGDCAHLYSKTGQALANVLDFIRDVSIAAESSPSISERIMVTIGDDIGDDVYNMYLAEEDQKRVVAYLLAKKLTT